MMKCETLIRPAIDFKTMWFNDVYSLGQRTELKSEFCLCLVCVCVYIFFFCGLELHVVQKPSEQLTHSHMMGPNQQAV